MSDIIDRQALKNKICDCCEGKDEWCNGPCFEIMIIDSMPAIAASPWHRVEELPKEDGKYLVYMFTSAWRWEFKLAGYLHGRWIGAGGGDVRYWMPIEPPKEDA